MVSAREARLLWAHVMDVPYSSLPVDLPDLSPTQQTIYDELCARRDAGEPFAKIIGRKAFWEHEFHTTQATLDPRPETEGIIEAILDHLPDRQRALKILDCGTGTGCILLSLLYEYPHATGVGLDISADAIAIAAHNAAQHNNFLLKRVEFDCLDWTLHQKSLYDVVVSNPPYISSRDICTLDVDVRTYDPILALDGGIDGLDAYRSLMAAMHRLLSPHGLLVCEIGQGQEHEVQHIAMNHGLRCVEIRQDLSGIARIIVWQWNENYHVAHI
ncbi:MAG: peptide chain release factor N(5)-glutamine methyltransferase [Alphaproteobacteria bacterium]|nr:MAG: peptide chain release factor N(5)-glutamine methyltransferase [Alphaproteobacteria bacterium]